MTSKTQMARVQTQPQAQGPGAQKMTARIASKFGVDPDKMLDTLKQTAFRQRPGKNGAPAVIVTNEQMMMLLAVAEQYNLNPFTREIYAFPSDGGIVAVVGVDGWIRIINERPELQSIEFRLAEEGSEEPWVECIIERKDRTKPIAIREYLSECKRETDPWTSHPHRMLRHKALIQCARVAFGYGGIYDPDEADRIVEAQSVVGVVPVPANMKPLTREPQSRSERAAATQAPEVELLSLDQQTTILDKLKEEGVQLDALLVSLKLANVELIPADRYQEAIEAIDALSA